MSSGSESRPGFREFVALLAMMISLVALSTDAMLPALATIGADLGVERANDNQLIISLIFLGMAVGQIAYGPLSDSYGRKPLIYAGYVLFILGCLLSIVATSFSMMLAGRWLQGVGAAGPRSVTMALVRDRYEGREMARVMSFVMVVFILVPALAPSLGQAVLLLAHWRWIFVTLLVLALVTVSWFALRQPETLPEAERAPFVLGRILRVLRLILGNRIALGYTLGTGLIYGAFLGYLNSAQQILQIQYGLGTRFPLYFAIIALSIGSASFVNGRLVMRFGMRALVAWSLRALVALSALAAGYSFLVGGNPSLPLLMLYFLTSFFCIGILFGNLNAMAMEPLGRVAGVGAAVVGSLSTLLSVPLGILIGQSYNGTVLPLLGGFAILGALAIGVMAWAETEREAEVAA